MTRPQFLFCATDSSSLNFEGFSAESLWAHYFRHLFNYGFHKIRRGKAKYQTEEKKNFIKKSRVACYDLSTFTNLSFYILHLAR
jgi:hypothetical protein